MKKIIIYKRTIERKLMACKVMAKRNQRKSRDISLSLQTCLKE